MIWINQAGAYPRASRCLFTALPSLAQSPRSTLIVAQEHRHLRQCVKVTTMSRHLRHSCKLCSDRSSDVQNPFTFW